MDKCDAGLFGMLHFDPALRDNAEGIANNIVGSLFPFGDLADTNTQVVALAMAMGRLCKDPAWRLAPL
jgi:hypothetical protein